MRTSSNMAASDFVMGSRDVLVNEAPVKPDAYGETLSAKASLSLELGKLYLTDSQGCAFAFAIAGTTVGFSRLFGSPACKFLMSKS